MVVQRTVLVTVRIMIRPLPAPRAVIFPPLTPAIFPPSPIFPACACFQPRIDHLSLSTNIHPPPPPRAQHIGLPYIAKSTHTGTRAPLSFVSTTTKPQCIWPADTHTHTHGNSNATAAAPPHSPSPPPHPPIAALCTRNGRTVLLLSGGERERA